MCRNERIDTPRRPRQKHLGIQNRGAQGPSQHPSHVHGGHPNCAVTGFQGQSDEELHEHVEHDVLDAGVRQRVGDEAPELVATTGVVHQLGAGWGRTCPRD